MATAPRSYKSPMSALWFLRNRRYTLFMVREFTGLVMAVWLFILLWVMLQGRLGGQSAYQAAATVLQAPWFTLFTLVTLFFSLFHSFSWFTLTGWVGLPAPGGKGLLTGPRVVAANVIGWALVSFLTWYLLFRGLR